MDKISFNAERIARYFRGELVEGDKEYINRVFGDYDDNDLEKFLKKHWYSILKEDEGEEKDLENVLYRIHYEINTKRPEPRKRLSEVVLWFSRIAAILILPVLIYSGIQFHRFTKVGNLASTEISAPAWTRAEFILPDGTRGWLNSNSSIRYKVNFVNNREVELRGEAFFDVEQDTRKPFRVFTEDLVVTALGTQFNIASYENERTIEVVLEEGAISCYNKRLNTSVSLKVNEYLIYNKTSNDVKVEYVQTEKYSSWKEGKLIFRDDPLDVVVRKLERWYNVDIGLTDERSDQINLRATFEESSLEEILRLLKLGLDIDYEITPPGIDESGVYHKAKVMLSTNNR
jgi:ferric-dicitrate binding protein FerR (iron transport regulator)